MLNWFYNIRDWIFQIPSRVTINAFGGYVITLVATILVSRYILQTSRLLGSFDIGGYVIDHKLFLAMTFAYIFSRLTRDAGA